MGSGQKPWGARWARTRYRDSLAAVSWREFEHVVATLFRSYGYEVVHRGTGGRGRGATDGGVDLVLRGFGETVLVDCKHANTFQVPYNPVAQLSGLVTAQRATRGIVITSGEFTPHAIDTANSIPSIELIDGAQLRALLAGGPSAWLAGAAERAMEPSGSLVLHAPAGPAGPANQPTSGYPALADAASPAAPTALATAPAASSPSFSQGGRRRSMAMAVGTGLLLAALAANWYVPREAPSAPTRSAAQTATAASVSPSAIAPDKPKPRPHVAKSTAHEKAFRQHTRPTDAPAAPAGPAVENYDVYKSADMSDEEFAAWKQRRAQRDRDAAGGAHEPPADPVSEAAPPQVSELQGHGPAVSAETMRTILKTNRP
jgi:hypothetical protein